MAGKKDAVKNRRDVNQLASPTHPENHFESDPKQGYFDMDVFDENTAPFSVGGNQGETSSTAAGKRQISKAKEPK